MDISCSDLSSFFSHNEFARELTDTLLVNSNVLLTICIQLYSENPMCHGALFSLHSYDIVHFVARWNNILKLLWIKIELFASAAGRMLPVGPSKTDQDRDGDGKLHKGVG